MLESFLTVIVIDSYMTVLRQFTISGTPVVWQCLPDRVQSADKLKLTNNHHFKNTSNRFLKYCVRDLDVEFSVTIA